MAILDELMMRALTDALAKDEHLDESGRQDPHQRVGEGLQPTSGDDFKSVPDRFHDERNGYEMDRCSRSTRPPLLCTYPPIVVDLPDHALDAPAHYFVVLPTTSGILPHPGCWAPLQSIPALMSLSMESLSRTMSSFNEGMSTLAPTLATSFSNRFRT